MDLIRSGLETNIQDKGGNLAFLGGSFDPVHLGHLIIAQDALEQLGFDKIILIPTRQNPLKKVSPSASDEHRLEMLRIAVSSYPRIQFSDHELRLSPDKAAYTVDTVGWFKQKYPRKKLNWILGSDQIPSLHLWKEIGKLKNEVSFVCASRPGYTDPVLPPLLSDLRLIHFHSHSIEISSTEIRKRIQNKQPVDLFLTRGVYDYIEKHRLYR